MALTGDPVAYNKDPQTVAFIDPIPWKDVSAVSAPVRRAEGGVEISR